MQLSVRHPQPHRGQVLIVIAVLSVIVAMFFVLLINIGFLRTSAQQIALGAMRNAALSGLQHTDPCFGYGWYYVKVEYQPTLSCDRGSSASGPDTQLPTGDQVVRDLLTYNLSNAGSNLFEGGYQIDIEVVNYSPEPDVFPDVGYYNGSVEDVSRDNFGERFTLRASPALSRRCIAG